MQDEGARASFVVTFQVTFLDMTKLCPGFPVGFCELEAARAQALASKTPYCLYFGD